MSNVQTPLAIWSETPFSSPEELVAAMQDPRYKASHAHNAYVAAVEAKIALSEGIGTDTIHVGTVEQSVYLGTDAAVAEQKAQEAEARRAFGEAIGPNSPMALPPAASEPRKETPRSVSPVHEPFETGRGY